MHLLIVVALFFATSLVFSMFGLGGGLVYVPLLVLSNYSIKVASIISLFAITLTSLAAFITFLRKEKFDWKLAAVIDPPTDIMAFFGGYYANLLDENVLRVVLVVVILFAGLLMVKQPRDFSTFRGKFTWKRKFKNKSYTVNIPLVGLTTGLIGFFSGMIGITGGVFKVPIMVLFCGVPIDIAIGTSSGMVFLTAFFGLIGHLTTTEKFSFLTVILVGLVCLVGGLLGAKISLKVKRKKLRVYYGCLMFILATWITLESLL